MTDLRTIHDAWKLTMEVMQTPGDAVTPISPCRHCHSSPSIAYKPRTGRWIAVHRTGCPLPTAAGASPKEVRGEWARQQEGIV